MYWDTKLPAEILLFSLFAQQDLEIEIGFMSVLCKFQWTQLGSTYTHSFVYKQRERCSWSDANEICAKTLVEASEPFMLVGLVKHLANCTVGRLAIYSYRSPLLDHCGNGLQLAGVQDSSILVQE